MTIKRESSLIASIAAFALGMGIALCGSQAKATVLFENVIDSNGTISGWCDPCHQPNFPNDDVYRVWDSFTLGSDSILDTLAWVGTQSDTLAAGINVTIASTPFGAPIYSHNFLVSDISLTTLFSSVEERQVTLPGTALSAGTYWLTVYGLNTSGTNSWWGIVTSDDNSLIQYGPIIDVSNSNPRNQDAVFRLEGELSSVPVPAALPLFASGLGVMGLLGWRRKRRVAKAAA